jgi:hypothetical protein
MDRIVHNIIQLPHTPALVNCTLMCGLCGEVKIGEKEA